MTESGSDGIRLVNLMAHNLTVFDGDEVVLDLPPDGPAVRVIRAQTAGSIAPVGIPAIPLVEFSHDVQIKNLPEPRDGVVYVVSQLSAAQMAGVRTDLVFPNGAVPDGHGGVKGCRGLGRFS